MLSPDRKKKSKKVHAIYELILFLSMPIIFGCALSANSPTATIAAALSSESPSTILASPSSRSSSTILLPQQTSTEGWLPEIASFASNPSDQFILDSDGMAMVSRTYPFIGSETTCAHRGAHTHFQGTGSQYTVDLYAPADGIIRLVTTCFNIGETDRYGFSLEFARIGNDLLVLNFSIEPEDGTPCAADPNVYKPYIFVGEGEKVKKGQVIGQMLKTALPSDGAHIHFDIQNERTGSFHCPNLFTQSIVNSFSSKFGNDVCGGIQFPDTFCYKPGPDEDLTGLFSIP
jgi:hypothetical protein